MKPSVPNEGADNTLDLEAYESDRYSRFRLIPWWDQELLSRSKILVVGTGAIGNELTKILALLGVGKVVVVDFDAIENSNLTRSVLFREKDEGRMKADVAAERALEINPHIDVRALNANIVYDVGLGVFREMDVVLGGLDNREARLAINQYCWRVNRPWVDGAIEVLNGIARMFIPPDGACYECTMGEMDYKLLNMRKSCALLSRDEMLSGKVPTTPTTAAVIAGMQVQEAIKFLHGKQVLNGEGFVFNGLTHDSYKVSYTRDEDCLSHDTYEHKEIVEWEKPSSETTLGELLERAKSDLGEHATLEFQRDVLTGFTSPSTGEFHERWISLGGVKEGDAWDSEREEMMRPEMLHGVDGTEDFLDRKVSECGIPPYDCISAKSGLERRHYFFSADRTLVLPDF